MSVTVEAMSVAIVAVVMLFVGLPIGCRTRSGVACGGGGHHRSCYNGGGGGSSGGGCGRFGDDGGSGGRDDRSCVPPKFESENPSGAPPPFP